MNGRERNRDWKKEYEDYVNYLENKDCFNNNYYYESNEYYDGLEAVKTIIESMAIIKEGMGFILEEDNINIRWTTDDMELHIDNIIPEEDTFCISVHIKPALSKNNNYRKENIIYFYEIQNEYISRNIIYSNSCPSIFNDGNDVLEEIFNVLKIFLTQ